MALQTLSMTDPLRTVHPICEAGTVMGNPFFQTTMGHEFGQSFDVTLWDDLGCNLYVSVNGFNSANSRKQANLRCVNELFFDLDMEDAHRSTATPEQIEQAKAEVLALLAQSIEDGGLPRPTMVVWTGRGLQLHYVLDKSMSYRLRTGAINRNGILVLKKTRSALDERMKAFCDKAGHGFASDPAVSDLSRICRVPGSVNQAASAIYRHPVRAELLDCEGPLWSITELDAFLAVARPGKSKRENPATERQIRWLKSFVDAGKLSKIPENVTIEQADAIIKRLREDASKMNQTASKGASSAAGVAETRMCEIRRLQELRSVTGREEGHRHVMAFLFMNSAMTAIGVDAALRETLAFNARFNNPLKDSEITSIHSSLSRKGSPYLFNFQTVCDKLELDAEEEALFGGASLSNHSYGSTSRKAKREQAKKQTAMKKRSRDERIAELADQGIGYSQIAEAVSCSRRTVCSVLAGLGYHRNVCHAKECNECPERKTCPFLTRDSFKVEIGQPEKQPKTDFSQVSEKCKKLSPSLRLFKGGEGNNVEPNVGMASKMQLSYGNAGICIFPDMSVAMARVGVSWRVQASLSKAHFPGLTGTRPGRDPGGG